MSSSQKLGLHKAASYYCNHESQHRFLRHSRSGDFQDLTLKLGQATSQDGRSQEGQGDYATLQQSLSINNTMVLSQPHRDFELTTILKNQPRYRQRSPLTSLHRSPLRVLSQGLGSNNSTRRKRRGN